VISMMIEDMVDYRVFGVPLGPCSQIALGIVSTWGSSGCYPHVTAVLHLHSPDYPLRPILYAQLGEPIHFCL
jgi:hypothetical protein